MTTEKKTDAAKESRNTIGVPTPRTGKLAENIHFHGPNARLNVDSIDSSTNTVSMSKDRASAVHQEHDGNVT